MTNKRVQALIRAVSPSVTTRVITDDDGWVPPPLVPEGQKIDEALLEVWDNALTAIWHRFGT